MKEKETKVYKERKKKAQFFTPEKLVIKLLEELDTDLKNKLILEPSCGEGAFVEKIYANNEIYAIDKDPSKTEYIKQKHNTVHVITSDFLKYATDLRFDLVIGNPPFNLATPLNYIDTTEGFISHAIDLVKEEGNIVLILPNTVLRNKKYQNIRKRILEETKIEKIIDTRGNDFLGADIETIAIFLKKQKVEKQIYTYISQGKRNVILLNRNERDTIKINNDNISNDLIKMIGNKKLNDFFEIYRGSSENENSLKGKHINFYNDTLISNGENYCIGLQNIAYRLVANVIKANDSEIADTITILKPKKEFSYQQLCYIANYLDTPIANYIIHVNAFNNSKLTIHVDKYYIEDFPVPDLLSIDNNCLEIFGEKLDKLRNNKEFANTRNDYFYRKYNIDEELKNEIETMWQFPKFKKKKMEKRYEI